MTQSPLQCCTSIIRSSTLVKATSTLSMGRARTWRTEATRHRNASSPFSRGVLRFWWFIVSHYCVSLFFILIERNPPPRGGFLFTMFPHQEPCVRGLSSKDLYHVLGGGSSYTRFLIREHNKSETPPGGGGFFRSICWTNNFKSSLELNWKSHSQLGKHV